VLLALTQAGVTREDAYAIVQRNAMQAWKEGRDFLSVLNTDKDVTAKLKPAQLEAMFDLGYHLQYVDAIFARVLGADGD
jgi:adenylosuccinate lyase